MIPHFLRRGTSKFFLVPGIIFAFIIIIGVIAYLVGVSTGFFSHIGCQRLKEDFSAYAESHNSCDSAADCQLFFAPNSCAFYLVGSDADVGYLQSLSSDYGEQCIRVGTPIVECMDPMFEKVITCQDNRCILISSVDE